VNVELENDGSVFCDNVLIWSCNRLKKKRASIMNVELENDGSVFCDSVLIWRVIS
jgi:hypothetical protein